MDNDFTPPDPQTDPRLNPGGPGSGVPPRIRTAMGLEDARRPPRSRLSDVFGIDFGDETMRLAGLINGMPVLTSPGIFPSIAVLSNFYSPDEEEHVVSKIRSRLREPGSVTISDTTIELKSLVTQYFENIRTDIAARTSYTEPKLVLTVPAYYCSAERLQLVNCANDAGFRVLGLINDYIAPVYSFVFRRNARSGNMLVVQLGAESCSAAIVSVSRGLIETKIARSFSGIGAEHVLQTLCETLNPSPMDAHGFSTSWLTAFVSALHTMKNSPTGELPLPADHNYIKVQRSDVLNSLTSIFKDILEVIRTMLDSSKLTLEEIPFILLSGKIFQIELVRRSLASGFSGSRMIVLNADKSASFGAAIRAGILDGQIEEPLIWDVLSQPIFVEKSSAEQIVIPANVTLPVNTKIPLDFDSDFNLSQGKCIDTRLEREPFILPWTKGIELQDNEEKLQLDIKINVDGLVGLSVKRTSQVSQ